MVSILDISIVSISILICVAIGIWSKRKSKANVENYLLADRKMPFVPTAFSVVATLIAGNNMTSFSAEVFRNGAQYLLLPLGFLLVQFMVAYLIVPILHNMEYTSIYQYLEYRFDKTMRIIYSLGFLLLNVILTSLYLFIPALCVTTLTDVPLWLTITSSGLICTLYCVLGGLRGVIWTDVFQTLLIVIGLLVLIIQGFVEMGNDVWRRTFAGRSNEHFRFYEDGTPGRYNVLGILVYGISISFVYNFGNQASAQRWICVKNKRQATKTAILSLFLLLIIEILVGLTAIIIFAKVTHCNPFDRAEEKLFMPDQLYVYGAEKILRHIPGCVGIMLAGLISAALSTVSSNINSFAAITLEDYLKWWFPQLAAQDKTSFILCQVLTTFYGILTVIIGMLIPYLGSVINATILIVGALGGPLSGALLLAFFMKRAHGTACKIGILVAFSVGLWLALGSYLSLKPKFIHLNHDTSGCHLDSSFGMNATIVNTHNSTNSILNGKNATESNDVFPLFTISTMWYSPICTALSALLGFSLSFCFRKPMPPDPRLVCHVVLDEKEKDILKRLLEEKAQRKQIHGDLKCSKEMQIISESV